MIIERFARRIIGEVYDIYLFLNPNDGHYPGHWDNSERWAAERERLQDYVCSKLGLNKTKGLLKKI